MDRTTRQQNHERMHQIHIQLQCTPYYKAWESVSLWEEARKTSGILADSQTEEPQTASRFSLPSTAGQFEKSSWNWEEFCSSIAKECKISIQVQRVWGTVAHTYSWNCPLKDSLQARAPTPGMESKFNRTGTRKRAANELIIFFNWHENDRTGRSMKLQSYSEQSYF